MEIQFGKITIDNFLPRVLFMGLKTLVCFCIHASVVMHFSQGNSSHFYDEITTIVIKLGNIY